MTRNQTLSGWIEETVDRTATTAEGIHRAIADLPLEILDRNGLFVKTVADVRRIQDRSIEAIYDTVRQVNHGVGELTAGLVGGEAEPGEEQRPAA
jgi:hypothetical protein